MIQMEPKPPQVYSWIESALKYKGRLVLVPTFSLKHQSLMELHSYAIVGHSGFQNTYAYAQLSLFWPGMKKDIYTFVFEFDIYRRNKGELIKPPCTLYPLPIMTSI